jgi:hypothetical protein
MTCSSKTPIISYITVLHYAQVLNIIRMCFNVSFVFMLQNIAIINIIVLYICIAMICLLCPEAHVWLVGLNKEY